MPRATRALKVETTPPVSRHGSVGLCLDAQSKITARPALPSSATVDLASMGAYGRSEFNVRASRFAKIHRQWIIGLGHADILSSYDTAVKGSVGR